MIKNVACGISGGVDSAVAAYFLKQKYNVIGVFMTNWDIRDEVHSCSVDTDREDAKYVCNHLKIPFLEANFVKEYWNKVFTNSINAYEKGFTPNPDIMCNKHIKFNSFASFCLQKLKVDAFATGHYARSSFGADLENKHSNQKPLLIRPLDLVKDQTFWLCQVDLNYLSHCMFPLGDIKKTDVKKVAAEIGLQKTLAKKESMGMCFIGKRKFRKFIDSYVVPKDGVFTLLESGEIIGQHKGIHHFTLGQKCGLSYGQHGTFVVHLNPETQEIKVVLDNRHPALFMKNVTTDSPHWLIENPPMTSTYRIRMQYQNRYCSIPCTISPMVNCKGLNIKLDTWFRCISPGQYAVLYSEDDRICLGSAKILSSKSAWEEGHYDSIDWKSNDYDNQYLFENGHLNTSTNINK